MESLSVNLTISNDDDGSLDVGQHLGSVDSDSATSRNADTEMSKSKSINKSQRSSFNDFVRKLFYILESGEYTDIISWSEDGSNFIVLDTNKFTTEILPKHFKHSNFASFVRQLNKYDFHKVKKKKSPGSENVQNTWEFNHPFFKQHDEAALDNIKRKPSSQKKIFVDENTVVVKKPGEDSIEEDITAKMLLKNTVGKNKFNTVKRKVEDMEKQVHFLTNENHNVKLELQKLTSKYNIVLESLMSSETMNSQLTSNFQLLIDSLSQQGFKLPGSLNIPKNLLIQKQARSSSGSPQSSVSRQTSNQIGISKHNMVDELPTEQQVLRPGFHVLLVEDDSVCIQLCSKFLRKYGCSVEVVTDGLSAISSLEKQRYDLVLMDIVMPNLDGATATSIVRSFDNETPIIAMTGNIDDQDLVTYLQHGMNDILAKPFTKDDLHSMLIRYLKDRIPLSEQKRESLNSVEEYAEEPLLKKSHI